MNTNSRLPRVLTVRDLARELKLTAASVHRLINNGQLRALHLGKALRIREDDVLEYLGGEEPQNAEAPRNVRT